MPQQISTAPRDGTVILTDCGFARFLDQNRWASPVEHGAGAECDPSGHIYECADNGMWTCKPKMWENVPDWIMRS